MRRKVIILLLSAAVAGTILVLAPASLARPADPIEPTETTAPADAAEETTAAEEAEARADLPAAMASLPLCTRTVNHNNGSQPVAVPAAGKNHKNPKSCLIGDGLVGCSDCSPIKTLQRALKTCHNIQRINGKEFEIDGYWGSQTKAALKAVQRRIGVSADGIYGPGTRNKMRHPSNDIPNRCFGF